MKLARPGFSTRIVLGFLAGVTLGLFFGEAVGWMKVAGDAFVGLLQMTVLPYIVVSLVTGLGRLEVRSGARLLGRAAVVMLGLWAVGLAVMLALPLALPEFETASFFSSSLVEDPERVDFLTLFIPLNVFDSLVRYTIPAVVLFCISLGVAVMAMERERKEALLGPLDVLQRALAKVNGFVVRLTPYGVLAITAHLAGTMTVEELGRVQGYVLVQTLSCLLLTFVVLPGVIAALTPFSARQVLAASKDALLTAFATGKVLIVLPLLVERTQALFREREGAGEDEAVEVLYPVAYPMPTLGKLSALAFLPFAAWFVGSALELGEFVAFVLSGVLSSFGSPIVTVAFLLAQLHLPADLLQLFLAPGFYTARLGDLVGGMHLVALVTITTAWAGGALRPRWRRLGATAALTALGMAAGMLATRAWLTFTVEGEYTRDQMVLGMGPWERPGVGPQRVEERIVDRAAPNPVPLEPGQSSYARIRERGVVRLGFRTDAYPWVFRGTGGELIGFDVDMAHALAADLDLAIEWVPVDAGRIAQQLAADYFDVAMGGIPATPDVAGVARLSAPYFEAHFALLVRDHRAKEFRTLAGREGGLGLRIAVPPDPYIERRARVRLPQAEVSVVGQPQEFLEAPEGRYDAYVTVAETGSAWSLLYPNFQPVRPLGLEATVHGVYLTLPAAEELGRVLDAWIELKRGDGTLDGIYAHWILGVDAERGGPRWCVARDVLGWLD